MSKKIKKAIGKVQKAYAEIVNELEIDMEEVFGLNLEIARQLFCEAALCIQENQLDSLFRSFQESCMERLESKDSDA